MDSLPSEIILKIFQYLPSIAVPAFERLSKHVGASIRRRGVFYIARPLIDVEFSAPGWNLRFTVKTPFSNYVFDMQKDGKALCSVTKNSRPGKRRAPEEWKEENLESSLRRFLQWMKENSANLYRKWGKPVNPVPTIPTLILNFTMLYYIDAEEHRIIMKLMKEMGCFVEIIRIATPHWFACQFAESIVKEKLCCQVLYDYNESNESVSIRRVLSLARECEAFIISASTYFLAICVILEIERLQLAVPNSLKMTFPKEADDEGFNMNIYVKQLEKFGVEVIFPEDLTKTPHDLPSKAVFNKNTHKFCCNFVEHANCWIVEINDVT